LLPELPFGPWLAEADEFDRDRAVFSLTRHDQGLRALASTGAGIAFITSRPMSGGTRLFNTAVILHPSGAVDSLHDKQVFSDTPGWHETTHFVPGPVRSGRLTVGRWRIATLLSAEAMFPELARAHGRAGADLILVPRASGADVELWRISLRMAALASGSFVASANKVGGCFTGGGMIVAPDGTVLTETTPDAPVGLADLDRSVSLAAKTHFPTCLRPSPALPREDLW
ncbi:MAG: carbon-nitrogen hydrolase family protein, partial [Pseudomonadota bacterium]